MFSIYLNHLHFILKPVISPAISQRYLKLNMPKTEIMAISRPQTWTFYIVFYGTTTHPNLKSKTYQSLYLLY